VSEQQQCPRVLFRHFFFFCLPVRTGNILLATSSGASRTAKISLTSMPRGKLCCSTNAMLSSWGCRWVALEGLAKTPLAATKRSTDDDLARSSFPTKAEPRQGRVRILMQLPPKPNPQDSCRVSAPYMAWRRAFHSRMRYWRRKTGPGLNELRKRSPVARLFVIKSLLFCSWADRAIEDAQLISTFFFDSLSRAFPCISILLYVICDSCCKEDPQVLPLIPLT
jgi:hypothetical protein